MMTIPDRELITGFIEEVRSYADSIRSDLDAFRQGRGDPSWTDAKRAAHTIKGAAAMLGYDSLSHFGFALETRFDRAVREKQAWTPAFADEIEQAISCMTNFVARLTEADVPDELLRAQTRLLTHPEGDSDSVSIGEMPNPSNASSDTIVGLDSVAESEDDTSLDLPRIDDTNLESPSFNGENGDDLPDLDFLTNLTDDAATVENPLPEVAANVEVSDELFAVFRAEVDDHLRVLTTFLPLAKSTVPAASQWQEIRRAAHTIKGSAAMVGFSVVTRLAHAMEDLLDEYFEGRRVATNEELDLLLAGADAIEDEIAGVCPPERHQELLTALVARRQVNADATPTPPAETTVEESAIVEPAAEEPRQAPGEPDRTIRVPLARLSDFSNLVGEQVISRSTFEQRMRVLSQLLGELQSSASRLRRASDRLDGSFETWALGGSRTTSPGGSRGHDEFDDLELDRYTEFHLVSRELSETAADLQTLTGELGNVHSEFEGYLTRQSRLSGELEDKLTRLRMVPLSSLAAKLNRTVRNTATATGKSVRLVFEGERTGLDKTVIEAMADSFLHILRNAVDHGIEAPEVRSAIGKPTTGTIVLRAEHIGNQFQLTIRDDGRGIDREAIRAAAIRRGLIDEAAADALDPENWTEFLFHPGFSTRSDISEWSGRGVGLDVVKTNVVALKGTVTVASEFGAGTTFTIRLPLTLAVIKALLVGCQDQQFAIPLANVEQIVRLDDVTPERIGHHSYLRREGGLYRIVQLAPMLGLQTAQEEPGSSQPVILIRSGDNRAAVVVDSLAGGREIFVKRLGPLVFRNRWVSGATITGEGRVVLILSPEELSRTSIERSRQIAGPVSKSPTSRSLSLLVVDDSPSVRRVLTSLLERQGWHVTTAKDGMDALEILQQTPRVPDIVLTDVEMPRMDGYELLATLRGQPATAQVPVVVITSRAAARHRKKAMDLGATAYVVKPYQDESLLELVNRFARSRASTVNG